MTRRTQSKQAEIQRLLRDTMADSGAADFNELWSRWREQHDLSDDIPLAQLHRAWEALTPARRMKLLDFAEDQRRLSVNEKRQAASKGVKNAGEDAPSTHEAE